MPNRRQHTRVGMAVGIPTALIVNAVTQYERIERGEQDGWNHLESLLWGVGGAAFGYFGGRLPDILDPPTSPNHRAFFHSLTAAGITICALRGLCKREDVPKEIKTAALAICAAYGSHLVMDAGTPMGLPLI